jgi:cell division septum initiation protein DivIVA
VNELEELRARVRELERALERERHTEFELRRQLLAADEAFSQLVAKLDAMRACRAHLARLLDAGHPGAEDPGSLRTMLDEMHRLLNGPNRGAQSGGRRETPAPEGPLAGD